MGADTAAEYHIVKSGVGAAKWGTIDNAVIILSYYIGALIRAILTFNF